MKSVNEIYNELLSKLRSEMHGLYGCTSERALARIEKLRKEIKLVHSFQDEYNANN